MPDDDVVIRVEHVSKDFILPHERTNSVKSLFTGFAKKNRGGGRKETQHALHDISLEIKRGEFFGVVGRNGSGKSTLLKILAGIYQPTSGTTQTIGKLVPFIELGVGFNGELTGRENVFLNGAMVGFTRKEIQAMYDDIVAFAELERFMDQKLKNYSSGMQVRLAFSLAIRAKADILLVDEVLAVGDADFQKKCFKYFRNLKRDKKTVVFVSHDMQAVQEYCDRAILIEQSNLVAEGSSHDVSMAYTRMFLDQEKGAEALKKTKQRWGSEEVKYTKASLAEDKLSDADKQLTLYTEAVVNRDVAQAILGFKVRAEDDTALTGSNTKLKGHELTNLTKGQRLAITWTFPNIFNTGRYIVDLAIQSENYEEVYDWWEHAATFRVERDEDNSYPVHPMMSVVVKTEK
jgi:ABC-2 type transport system ATP-binding protein